MKGKLLLPNETIWRPSDKQIAAREQLLYDLGFKKNGSEWKFKKAFILQELVIVAHDDTFVQVLQISLMQNFIEPIRHYMTNSDETV